MILLCWKTEEQDLHMNGIDITPFSNVELVTQTDPLNIVLEIEILYTIQLREQYMKLKFKKGCICLSMH